ncbi:Sua5 family C-terminal domain-containing protein, partial [Arthrospira platensis SPKY1]|nr:Sua5 family C-terminal domain-containing protein [Arthrospira platensis SPKY1]
SESTGNPTAIVRCYRSTVSPQDSKVGEVFWLSELENPEEIATNLFALLHRLDNSGFTSIHWELPDSEKGIARAIHDRLQRAAFKFR